MNTQFDELLSKHLNGSLTADEKQLLAAMLKEPENQLYLASKIDGQFLDSSLKEVGDEESRIQIFQGIQEQLKEAALSQPATQQPAIVVQIAWYRKKIFRSIAVAASIILVIALGSLWFIKKMDEPAIAIQQNNKPTDSVGTSVRHELNTTGKEKRIQLADGSLIVLADKSEINYREPFTSKREIILTGKAYFKVAKDKTRPFTVVSGDISTTALGTEFTVTTFENSNQVVVRLYEGKVVVKAVDKANRKLKKDVYLLPGQAFIYGSETKSNEKTFKLNSNAAPEQIIHEELFQDNPSIPENAEGSWYMFNNQSLDQIFDQLAEMYHVEIVYDKKDVNNLYFIGKYYKSESVENILKEIATLNDLTVIRKDSTFIISK